jgi:hypothetical protein
MNKVAVNSFFLLVFIVACCDSDSSSPSLSGNCRVVKIIYKSTDEVFEQYFEYNSDGLLTGYNTPYQGTACREELEYDNQQRLIRRTNFCGDNLPQQMIEYTYLTPSVLKGKYVSGDEEHSILLYYNANFQLDSAHWTFTFINQDSSNAIYQYDHGNLTFRDERAVPCCRMYTTSETRYDSGKNPFMLLKQASNNLGMESIYSFYPTPASVNNLLESKVVWQNRLSEIDPRIVVQQVWNDSFTYEYYPNSSYPAKQRRFSEGVPTPGEVVFVYGGCK